MGGAAESSSRQVRYMTFGFLKTEVIHLNFHFNPFNLLSKYLYVLFVSELCYMCC